MMDLETQTQLTLNQLKRQTGLVDSLQTDLDLKNKQIKEQQDQAEELARKHTDMEGKLKDQSVRERIRDVEKAQSIAELKQIISNLEFQVSNQNNTSVKIADGKVTSTLNDVSVTKTLANVPGNAVTCWAIKELVDLDDLWRNILIQTDTPVGVR